MPKVLELDRMFTFTIKATFFGSKTKETEIIKI